MDGLEKSGASEAGTESLRYPRHRPRDLPSAIAELAIAVSRSTRGNPTLLRARHGAGVSSVMWPSPRNRPTRLPTIQDDLHTTPLSSRPKLNAKCTRLCTRDPRPDGKRSGMPHQRHQPGRIQKACRARWTPLIPVATTPRTISGGMPTGVSPICSRASGTL